MSWLRMTERHLCICISFVACLGEIRSLRRDRRPSICSPTMALEKHFTIAEQLAREARHDAFSMS